MSSNNLSLEAERYKGFTDEDWQKAVKYIPSSILGGEICRRLFKQEDVIENVTKALKGEETC